MPTPETRLADLGLVLPPAFVPPPGVRLPFKAVRVVGTRAFVSGHGPQRADGSMSRMRGRVGEQVSPDQAYEAARLTALSMLGSLQRELGSLQRIAAWVHVLGMVNAAPGFNAMPGVINGFSDLILDVFGDDIGAHARSAIGVAELPFDIPVEIEGELLLHPQ
jgi:enamine deaminase RidA (YjgF/YER057c/UK114 family)